MEIVTATCARNHTVNRPTNNPTRVIAAAMVWLSATLAAGRLPAGEPVALRDARNQMVDSEIVAAGVKDPRVIQAMRDTPRHEFMPVAQRRYAYYDMSLPIGHGQTISAPFVVAYMTEQLDPQPTDRVLEIGTGSGYQAAVLSSLVRDVYTIEIVEPLARKAAKTLERLGYKNVHARAGDGYQGWPEHAPFDKIIVTCSPELVPRALFDQLVEGGKMIIPVGERYQQTLYRLTKREGKLVTEKLAPTLFVPMTGVAEDQRRVQPDPANPHLANGSFEEFLDPVDETAKAAGAKKPRRPDGWYYQRQLEVVRAPLQAPLGDHYAKFVNKHPGRLSQALQGFAIDGRKVRRLEVSLNLRARNIRPGQDRTQLPVLAIVFYDQNREILGQQYLGPWRGTFDWQRDTAFFQVPPRAREAILRLGLFGATGELWVDNVEVKRAQ